MTCNSALTDREFCSQVQLVQVHAQERALGWWIHVRDPILLEHLAQVWIVQFGLRNFGFGVRHPEMHAIPHTLAIQRTCKSGC